MRQRVLAILGAIALVVVAVVVRSMIADGPSSGSGDDGDATPVVACTLDLQGVCDALVADGKIADGTASLDLDDGAAAPDAGIDGWITWDPAPGIANIDAEQGNTARPWRAGRPLGSSALAVAIRTSGGPTFPDSCTQVNFDWSCLHAAATEAPPQPVGVGPGLTAESLARLHPLARTLLPDPADGFDQIAAADLRALIDSPADGQERFPAQLRTLRTAPGVLDFVVGPAEAMDGLNGVAVIQPKGDAAVVVVLALRSDGDADLSAGAFDSDRVQAALRAAGVLPGSGRLAPEERAGDLHAVRNKVG